MELTDEQKKKIAKESFEAMMEMAVSLAILNLDGKWNAESAEDRDAIKTLIYGLMGEDEGFKKAFVDSGIKILQTTAEIQLLKPFQWDTKERLKEKNKKFTFEFGKYLGGKLQQYINFPDKKIRDKLRDALGDI